MRLIRDGAEPTKYHRNDIAVGDIVMIDHGINVPVDGIVLESIGVKLDESAMTGESDHFSKEPLEKCQKLKAEFLEENKDVPGGAHEVPSCVILSGTQV